MGKKILITVAFAVVFATFNLLVKAQDPASQNANTQKNNTMSTRASRRGAKSNNKAAATTGVAQDPATPNAVEATPAMQTEATTPKTTTKRKRGRQTTKATDTTAT